MVTGRIRKAKRAVDKAGPDALLMRRLLMEKGQCGCDSCSNGCPDSCKSGCVGGGK